MTQPVQSPPGDRVQSPPVAIPARAEVFVASDIAWLSRDGLRIYGRENLRPVFCLDCGRHRTVALLEEDRVSSVAFVSCGCSQ